MVEKKKFSKEEFIELMNKLLNEKTMTTLNEIATMTGMTSQDVVSSMSNNGFSTTTPILVVKKPNRKLL